MYIPKPVPTQPCFTIPLNIRNSPRTQIRRHYGNYYGQPPQDRVSSQPPSKPRGCLAASVILRRSAKRRSEHGGAAKLLGRYGDDIVKCFSTL